MLKKNNMTTKKDKDIKRGSLIPLTSIIIFFFFFLSVNLCNANTVTVIVENIKKDISGFDLFFYEPDGNFGWPMGKNLGVSDFYYEWGEVIPSSGDDWVFITYIQEPQQNVHCVRGVYFYADPLEVENKLNEGIVIELFSSNTIFGINPLDSRNKAYDFQGDYGEVIHNLKFNEEWVGNNQIFTITEVPIPPTLFFFAAGILGLIGLKRNRNRREI